MLSLKVKFQIDAGIKTVLEIEPRNVHACLRLRYMTCKSLCAAIQIAVSCSRLKFSKSITFPAYTLT